ncbi:MAG: hypothetical protein QM657_18375 [Lacrimispora sp.]|uniref:hypothetical protein n=1 Tax=Lacrimispora sp. TaxID=2719234 RepID=UPI0039E5237C
MSDIKTEETAALERSIRLATYKMGTFGCFEVTIGFGGSERVDYMTYDTKGIFRCYEIKVSKSDFHSKAAKSFVGHYNFYVMPQNLYNAVKDEIPPHIGVYTGGYCVKRAKKQQLSVPETILKDSMIRSLHRDSDKLYKTESEDILNRLYTEIRHLKSDQRETQKDYNRLYRAVLQKYGINELRILEEVD